MSRGLGALIDGLYAVFTLRLYMGYVSIKLDYSSATWCDLLGSRVDTAPRSLE
jgi:hypothetical protein